MMGTLAVKGLNVKQGDAGIKTVTVIKVGICQIKTTAQKVSVFGVILVHIFPALGLNAGRYGVSLRIQSECGKMRIRITPNTGTFYAVNVCSINDTSSSESMEKAAAVEMFGRSISLHNPKYTAYVGDGDSSSFGEVCEAMKKTW